MIAIAASRVEFTVPDPAPRAGDPAPPDTLNTPLAAFIGLVLIGGALAAFRVSHASQATSSMGVEALGGLLLLSSSLAGLIVVAKALGIATPNAALGLPSGSVRALLAFSLVLVFVAVASWTLGGFLDGPATSGHKIATFEVPAAEAAPLIERLTPTYPPANYLIAKRPGPKPENSLIEVSLRPDANAQQQIFDTAKQVMTIVATVLVTVVGFYFGSNASTEAVRSAGDQIRATRKSLDDASGSTTGPSTPTPILSAGELARAAAAIRAAATSARSRVDELGSDPVRKLRASVGDAAAAAEPMRTQLDGLDKSLADIARHARTLASAADRADAAVKDAQASGATAATLKAASDTVAAAAGAAMPAGADLDAALARYKEARANLPA